MRLGSLEVGRFIAANLVLVGHFIPFAERYAAARGHSMFGGWLPSSPLGVQYFFVLSGFVMASAHVDDFGKLSAIPKFWWRRACRIYPAYWLSLFIPMYYLWRSLDWVSGLHLYLLDPWSDVLLNPVAWTLRFEIAFYIALGLCMLPYAGRLLLAAWVFTSIWSHMPLDVLAFMHLGPPFWPNHLYAAIGLRFGAAIEFYFFGGLAAGWVYRRRPPGKRLNWALLCIGAALLLGLLPGCHYGADYGPTGLYTVPLALSLALIILGFAGLERHGVLRLGKTAAWLGALSYPLYLLHAPLTLAATIWLPPLRLHPVALYVFFTAGLAALYAITALATFCFDQPLQRALRRIG